MLEPDIVEIWHSFRRESPDTGSELATGESGIGWVHVFMCICSSRDSGFGGVVFKEFMWNLTGVSA